MLWVIKRVSIYLFLMPFSLAQWRGEIDPFYYNALAFSNISIIYLILSLSYESIFCKLDLIKLLFQFICLVLNEAMFFHFKKPGNNSLKIGLYPLTTLYFLTLSTFLECIWVASRIISLSGDIEINPGLKSNTLSCCFSICQWNLNSISLHLLTKVSLPSSYISVDKFDIVCLS